MLCHVFSAVLAFFKRFQNIVCYDTGTAMVAPAVPVPPALRVYSVIRISIISETEMNYSNNKYYNNFDPVGLLLLLSNFVQTRDSVLPDVFYFT